MSGGRKWGGGREGAREDSPWEEVVALCRTVSGGGDRGQEQKDEEGKTESWGGGAGEQWLRAWWAGTKEEGGVEGQGLRTEPTSKRDNRLRCLLPTHTCQAAGGGGLTHLAASPRRLPLMSALGFGREPSPLGCA